MSTEWPVCLLDWDSKSCVPKMLMWGHSYCSNCLDLLYKETEEGGAIQCPTCMQEHKFNNKEEMEQRVATNFSLIQKPPRRLQSNREMGNDLDQEEENFTDENFNIEIEPNAKWSKHNKAIHSYVKTNKVLLCSDCIEEGNYPKSKIKSITQVVKETRGSMYSYKLKLNQNLLQLKRFREIIERIKEDNQKKVQENIKKHFRKVNEILKNAEKLAQQKFDVHKKKQEKKVRELVDGLKDIETILWANKTQLHEYIHSPNDDLVFELEKIEKIINTTVDIIPKIEIPDFKIKFSTDEGDLVKIDHFLNTMHLYSIINNDPNEVKKLLKDSFLIENYWICHTWSSQNKTILNRKADKSLNKELVKNKLTELVCLTCKSFKPLELYPSFYYNKEKISQEELHILSKRRNIEKKNCTKLDANYNKNNEEWFIIHTEWLKDWKMFTNNKRSSTAFGARRSTHKDVGILDPGPITNHQLLDENNQPLPGLVKGKHYRGVNKAVWKQFYETYGGGPVLRKWELSIYSEDFKESKEKEDKKAEDEDGQGEVTKANKVPSQMMKRYSEDEENIGRNSGGASQRQNGHFGVLSRKRTNLSRRRGVEVSAESNFRRAGTHNLDSNLKKNLGSSIPRRNLFKKKNDKKESHENSWRLPANGIKKQAYKPLYDRDNSLKEEKPQYRSSKILVEDYNKRLEGKFSLSSQNLRLYRFENSEEVWQPAWKVIFWLTNRRKSGDLAKELLNKQYDSDENSESSEDGGISPIHQTNIFNKYRGNSGFSKLNNLFGRNQE